MKVVTPKGRSFDTEDLQALYRQLPTKVLEDLAVACGAGITPFADTDRETCRLIGRLDVWQHINRFLGLSQAELEAMYQGRGFEINMEKE